MARQRLALIEKAVLVICRFMNEDKILPSFGAVVTVRLAGRGAGGWLMRAVHFGRWRCCRTWV